MNFNAFTDEDKKVYKFIESEECDSFFTLKTFLYENNLPLRSTWAYYYLGKAGTLNADGIKTMSEDEYGEAEMFEIDLWREFLRDETTRRNEIINKRIEENGGDPQSMRQEAAKQKPDASQDHYLSAQIFELKAEEALLNFFDSNYGLKIDMNEVSSDLFNDGMEAVEYYLDNYRFDPYGTIFKKRLTRADLDIGHINFREPWREPCDVCGYNPCECSYKRDW